MTSPELYLQAVRQLLPEFEAAVYNPLVSELYGELDTGPELKNARTHIARSSYCRETTESGYEFLTSRLGSEAVQHEVHRLPDEDHHFLRIGSACTRLAGADLIIDPTYLQYFNGVHKADLSALTQHYPRVFLGTRLTIVKLMLDPAFRSEKARLYGPETWVREN